MSETSGDKAADRDKAESDVVPSGRDPSPAGNGESPGVDVQLPAGEKAFFPLHEEKTMQSVGEKLLAHSRPSIDGHSSTSLSPAPASSSQPMNLSSSQNKFESQNSPPSTLQPVDNCHDKATTPDVKYVAALESPITETDQERGTKAEIHAYPASSVPSSDLLCIFESLRKCIELREKYIRISLQRLGDNPRDHDGVFFGFSDDASDVSGIKPDASLESILTADNDKFTPWKIYPPPPPPHWNYKKRSLTVPAEGDEEFDFTKCYIPCMDSREFRMDEMGVFQVYEGKTFEAANKDSMPKKPLFDVPTLRDYFVNLEYVQKIVSDGPFKSFAYRRLKILASKFTMFSLENDVQETADMKRVPHRDFYNLRKVDTHVHHSSCMNQKHLLRFIKSKVKRSPNDVVIFRDGAELTLAQVFQTLKLTAYDLSIDSLDMHAHQETFHRFDKFNLKYNPIGESRLREIFLKTDNFIQGRYLAELTKEVMTDLEQSKYQNSEWRISIYGRSAEEWDKLAKWIVDNKLYSHHVRWLIQVPRLYNVYRANGSVNNFEDIITNVFKPLFEVTKDPSTHPELHVFLQRVVGFDSVDDESKSERRIHRKYPFPNVWNDTHPPPYSYWIYYMFANMTSLNNWRRLRGFNTFVLRPHSGEAGDTDHLTSAFLTSHSISHGILLRKVPGLQYLFYLKQIGLAMSPLSNNELFLTYDRNPFPDFFKAGLNVSLSTDDPLQFHLTKEPLLEEYSVASHIYKLTHSSLAELARNSVIQSGFDMEIKRHWLGETWYLPGAAGNDINKTNVPDIRLKFRHDTLMEELAMIQGKKAVTKQHLLVRVPSPEPIVPRAITPSGRL